MWSLKAQSPKYYVCILTIISLSDPYKLCTFDISNILELIMVYAFEKN